MNPKLKTLIVSDFINVYGFGVFAPLYAIYAVSLGATAAQAAYIWSLYTLLGGLSTILFGFIENRFKHKEQVVINGYIIQATATVILFMATNLPWLIIALCLYAIGNGISTPGWKMLYAKQETKGHETEQWGIVDGGNNLLFSLAAASAGLLIGIYGFKGILLVMMVAHILGALVVLRLRQRPVRRK